MLYPTLRFKALAILLFPLLSAASLPAGTLSGAFQMIPTGSNVDLTAVGKLDWVHWGLFTATSIDRKASVSPQISNFTLIGNSSNFLTAYQYSGNSNSYSWYDSSEETVVTNTTPGVYGGDDLGDQSGHDRIGKILSRGNTMKRHDFRQIFSVARLLFRV